MRVRHRGFALAIVLVAVIGVFALAMQSAVMSRSTTIEARVLRERAEGERAAASAATIVLLALTGSDVSGPSGLGASGGASGAGGGAGSFDSPPPQDPPGIELPPIIRELLGAKADELENRAREETESSGAQRGPNSRSADGGGITGRVSRRQRSETEVGITLPGDPVDVPMAQSGTGEPTMVCRVRLSDAAGGLSINTASEDEIRRYLTLKVTDPLAAMSLADEILDWRDEDDFTRPRGAERSAYERRGMVCRNGTFVSREELLYLPSMTRAIFDSLRDDISLDGDGRVHAGSASREVLASLPGMDTEVADEIIRLRRAGELTEQSLEAAIPLFAREARDRLRANPSSILRLHVEVRRGSGDAILRYEGLAVAGERGVRALGLKPL